MKTIPHSSKEVQLEQGRTFRTRDAPALICGELRNDHDLAISFLHNGSIFTAAHGGIMINQVVGSPIDGALGNIYIRSHGTDGITFFPIMGPSSASLFRVAENAAAWSGEVEGLRYECMLRMATQETMWFWEVRIRNQTRATRTVDVVLTQDLGLASPAAVRSNELYTSQYIDHQPLTAGPFGYVVCSRQNLQQEGKFPWIMHGCFAGAEGFATDGFQLFGLEYRRSNVPTALTQASLPNLRYQYEMAMPAIQSRRFDMRAGEDVTATYFAAYVPDHPEATSVRDLDRIEEAEQAFTGLRGGSRKFDEISPLPSASSVFDSAPLFAADHLTLEEVSRYFDPDRRHEELRDGALLSFFYGENFHVVAGDKELLSERPHGHVIRSGQTLSPDENCLSVTAWMNGAFASHVAIGNTNFNKLLTICRNPLNVLKSSGTRIFVETASGYVLLGVPSAFEMGMNSARWIYRGAEWSVIVKTWTSMTDPACFMEISVEGQTDLAFLISNNVLVGDLEFVTGCKVRIDRIAARAELCPAADEPISHTYDGSRFFILATDPTQVEAIGGDELLFVDGKSRDNPYVVFRTKSVARFTLAFTGNIVNGQGAMEVARRCAEQPPSYGEALSVSAKFWRDLRKNATLSLRNDPDLAARLTDIIRWYANDAMVHFTTPYGLEQYSGAAWGTRDVCQGPIEFLVATRNFRAIPAILRTVYAHQFSGTGDWPQWFMFDRYCRIQAPDSHGDVVIWPLKALCDYIEATDDLDVLDEEIPFTDDDSREVTDRTASLFHHTLKQIEHMKRECHPNTALPLFGNGDWEDTLQPADPAARRRWVSPWTVELTYETLRRYARVCLRAGRSDVASALTELCSRIREDFNRCLVKDGVVAGLVDFTPSGPEYLIHPEDGRTGLHFRLLPISRGILSEMFTPERARDHIAIVDKYLKYPDGVRLMDRPMEYHGGVERIFRRAESAANFGREIGLQYVHAHIRYIQAMAKTGRPDDVMWGLMAIDPIGMQTIVPSACRRQSNAYFSSSDAAFLDRYQASEEYTRLRTSDVGVKGGWRTYSSGPGIYISQVIGQFLGLREFFSDVLLDPVLPRSMDGLTFDFEYEGRVVRYAYHVSGEGFSPIRVAINGADVVGIRHAENPYRRGGALIPKSEFLTYLHRDENLVEIFI